jgi:hypothetical protein
VALRKAADTTISFIDGKTEKERQEEAERIQANLDVSESHKTGSPTIEDNADRYRANAFSGQEFVTKHFGDPTATTNQYRLTTKNGMMYLEQSRSNGATGAYGYAGVMLPRSDLPALARVVVDAAKRYISEQGK